MIKHVVLWDVAADKQANIIIIKDALESLVDTVSEIRFLEVGLNVGTSPRAKDIMLTVHFDSLEDLEAYRIHPEHQKVVKILSGIAVDGVAIDYEI